MDTGEVQRKALRNGVDRLLRSARSESSHEQRIDLDSVATMIERERREIDDHWARVSALEDANRRLIANNEKIVAENQRHKNHIIELERKLEEARGEKARAIGEKARAFGRLATIGDRTFSILVKIDPNQTFVDPLDALRRIDETIDQWKASRESLRDREVPNRINVTWNDATGWVSTDTLRSKYPPKRLRCYSCGHELEFASPEQANRHGWRALAGRLAAQSNVVCQKPRCASIAATRLIRPEDFGWKSLHPVDALVELGVIGKGSEFEADLRGYLERGPRIILANTKMTDEDVRAVQKALDDWNSTTSILFVNNLKMKPTPIPEGDRPRNSDRESLPTRVLEIDRASWSDDLASIVIRDRITGEMVRDLVEMVITIKPHGVATALCTPLAGRGEPYTAEVFFAKQKNPPIVGTAAPRLPAAGKVSYRGSFQTENGILAIESPDIVSAHALLLDASRLLRRNTLLGKSSAVKSSTAQAAATGGLEDALVDLSQPSKQFHPPPRPENRCACPPELIRITGVLRPPDARWPVCNYCEKFISQPKEATMRRIIFRVP